MLELRLEPGELSLERSALVDESLLEDRYRRVHRVGRPGGAGQTRALGQAGGELGKCGVESRHCRIAIDRRSPGEQGSRSRREVIGEYGNGRVASDAGG